MERKASTAPFVDGTIPTTLDKKLAPEGTHVFSMFTQWVPDDWNTEPHRDELDAYAQRIFDGYNELAPNFKDSIIDYQVIGPYDMEQDLGLIGGNIFHGELSVDQLFHMRPAPGYADYRTPLRGPLPRVVRHARRRRRERHPRLAGLPHGQEGQGAGEEVARGRRPVASRHGRTPIQRMLEARSVAVVGASIKPGSLGESMLAELRRGGFDGAIYPVNPGYDEVAGLPLLPVDRWRCPSRSTWRSSAWRTPGWSRRSPTPRRPARAARSRSRRCTRTPGDRPGSARAAARRSPSRTAWRCAAATAWGS